MRFSAAPHYCKNCRPLIPLLHLAYMLSFLEMWAMRMRGCMDLHRHCLVVGCKVVTWGVSGGVAWGVRILIKNKLQNSLINRETNLLSLINPSLAYMLL
jgi:hypothetical protein